MRKLTSLFFLLVAVGCTANKGTLTVTNPTLETKNIFFNDRTIAIAPEQHFTQKGLSSGNYEVIIGKDDTRAIEIKKGRTTVIDIGGDNCFVVVDYKDQYDEKGNGRPKVMEKFVNKPVFITNLKVTSELGEKLPETTHRHKEITRIHRVDCSWIDNNEAIVDAISNLP